MRVVCAVVGLAAAMVALIALFLLADDWERWLPALLWLVLAGAAGAVAAILHAVTGGREPERERVR